MFAESCNYELRDRRIWIRSSETGERTMSREGGYAAATIREEVRARTSRRACFRWVTSSVSISPRKLVRAEAHRAPAAANHRCRIGKRYVFAGDSRYRRVTRGEQCAFMRLSRYLKLWAPARSWGASEHGSSRTPWVFRFRELSRAMTNEKNFSQMS